MSPLAKRLLANYRRLKRHGDRLNARMLVRNSIYQLRKVAANA